MHLSTDGAKKLFNTWRCCTVYTMEDEGKFGFFLMLNRLNKLYQWISSRLESIFNLMRVWIDTSRREKIRLNSADAKDVRVKQ